MKKLIILAVAGLLIGIGGGTGAAIALRPTAGTDSTATDSSAAQHDTTAVIDAAPVAEHAPPPADSAAADTMAPTLVAHSAAPIDSATPSAAPVPVLVTQPGSDSLERAQVRRIGRIFAAMAPREASKVLQQLDDADVRVIVASLTEKQAAAILQAFPPERAAAISRGSLRAAQQGQRP